MSSPKTMTFDEARAELEQAVYAACALLERLADAGVIRGSGRGARQAVADAAVQELVRRWCRSETRP